MHNNFSKDPMVFYFLCSGHVSDFKVVIDQSIGSLITPPCIMKIRKTGCEPNSMTDMVIKNSTKSSVAQMQDSIYKQGYD